MLRYVITIVLITMLGVGEISAQSAKSDSLFAIGVDLYNAGKYQEAIPIFEESDKLDKIELDLSSNRRDYSAMWLASCYYNLGDTVKAKSISDYYYINKPIDRRITIESDSIDMIKTNSREEVLSHRYTCASIEKDLLGSTNIWYGNTLMNILLDNFVLGKFEEINNVIIDLQPIFSANKIWAYEHYEMIVSITGKLMEIYSNEVQKRINLLNAVCNLSRIFYDLKYGDKFDFCYGAFISKLMEALAEANHLEEAIEVGENARNMMKTPLPIYNRSRNRILADLGTLYAKGHLDQEKQRDPSLSYDFMNKRWPIYEEAEDVIDKTEGKYSYDWSLLQIKKSNSYIWHPEHLDFEGCKQYLHNAFDAYSKISRDSIEKKLYLSLLLDDYHKFDLLNDEQSFIDYAYEILSPDTLISYNYVWAYIADAYNSNNVNRRDKAIEIYQYFYDHARSHNDEAEAIMFMKSKALAEYLLKRYEEAARDYLEIDALLKEAKEGYSPSNHGNILHDLALCYGSLLGLNDSLKYNAFNSKAIEYKKNAVHSNDNYNPSYSTINKIDDMINIAEWTETTFGNISSWKFVEGIKCYKEALDTVLIKKLEPTQLKYYLYRLYSTIGRNYIFLNNFEAANDYLGKALTISNDTLSYEYNGIMDQYAVLYDRVSIEPEIALHYYFRQVSLSEDRLKLMKNQLLPNAIITETDLLINNWNKCAEKFEYLGNNEDVLKCLDRKLELLT